MSKGHQGTAESWMPGEACGGLIYPCEIDWGTRSLAPGSGRCSKGSSTNFPRLALWSTIFAAADRPAALAVVFWPTYAGSGFNSWEGHSHHHPRDPTPMSLRPGVWLWEIGLPKQCCLFGSGTVRPLESWKRSRPPVSSHRVTVTSSQGTQLLSARASRADQIILRPRMNPRSLTTCYRPTRAWATARSSTPSMDSRTTWAWTMLCCPRLLSSPSSTGPKHRGRTSTPRCPFRSGLYYGDIVGRGPRIPQHTDPSISVTVHVRKGRHSVPRLQSPRTGRCKSSSPNIWGHWSRGVNRSSAATSFVVRSTWMTASWPLEEALGKDRTPSLSRCWISPSWDSSLLGTKPVSVTV